MSSELEEVVETVHELIREELDQDHDRDIKSWINWVALSTMVMALLSAMGALLAANASTELMVERTNEILEVTRLQGDRIDVELLQSKHVILDSLGKAIDSSELEKIRKFQEEIQLLRAESQADEAMAQAAIFEHYLFEISVTFLSIGITLSGMSVITRKRHVWMVGLVFAFVGTSILGTGIYKLTF